MARGQMIPDDETRSYARTSLTMTRAISSDIGMKLKKIMEQIYTTLGAESKNKENINLSYAQWQETISYLWNDEIWIMALNKLIARCQQERINLNKNKYFLLLVVEKSPSELKAEFKKTHPISKLSLMDLVTKEPSKPDKKRKYEDLWMTEKELKQKYKDEDQ